MVGNNEGWSVEFWLFGLLVLSLIELRKAILVLIKNQFHLFFFAQIGVLMLRLYPGNKEKKYTEVINNYKKNIKIYSIFTIIGAVYFIFIAMVGLFR